MYKLHPLYCYMSFQLLFQYPLLSSHNLFLSFQHPFSSCHPSLGSRNFVDYIIWKTLFKSHWITVSHTQLYECCGLRAISTGNPVLIRPASHVKMLCFNIRIATFLLINLMSNQISWIPDWDDKKRRDAGMRGLL
ncbi:hypothetical protein GZ064_03390 [Wolbachia endosymbiont of Diaphorina citri]|jgi:hypothetical protein|nr:hypothetical protein FK497_04230 [Wolbachia endosymbiont of Diaphorina citri]QXY86988.1 hypothetical protein GZ064_03390 [Wolbachia endosymbiont of Diaphorina citri]QXY88201.1 hypothetical protein GZ065_03450 [Wolbachia endosymbiont of Diaphorina citri]QXY89559.1 hypothetical protein GZ066_04445 [Wolbachia endosymbiont of Diaphorina citri]